MPSRLTGTLLALLYIVILAPHGVCVGAQAPAPHPLLVESSWLATHIDTTQVLIIDVRAASAYKQAHIRNAINIAVDDTYDQTPREDMIGQISTIRSLMSHKGLTKEHHLVLYDNGEFIHAARVFWVLEVYGHKRVSLLNSGFASWRAQGFPVSSQMHEREASRYIPTIAPRRLATKFSTRLAIAKGDKVLIDVRPEEEYQGRVSLVERFGHIPGALNISWEHNLIDPEGHARIRPRHELQTVYAPLAKDRRIITYCNRGRHSALTYFVLRYLDYDVATYDGSWYEWGSDAHLPIVSPMSTTAR